MLFVSPTTYQSRADATSFSCGFLGPSGSAPESLHPFAGSVCCTGAVFGSGALAPQAFLLLQLVQSIQQRELSDVRPLPKDKLMAMQHADPCLCRVLQFVERQRCPSRACT